MYFLDVIRADIGESGKSYQVPGTLVIDPATGQPAGFVAGALSVNTLRDLGAPTGIGDVGETAQRLALPANGGAISLLAFGGRVRFALGDDTVVATADADSHVISDGERMEFGTRLLDGTVATHISVIGDDGVTGAQVDISGLGQPADS